MTQRRIQVIVNGRKRGEFSEAGVKLYLSQTNLRIVMNTATVICLEG